MPTTILKWYELCLKFYLCSKTEIGGGRGFTLCIESIFWGLQYCSVWGSSLWDQMADTEAWHPCVTTLPSGHVSIRSRRSTTYWTSTSELSFSAFTLSSSWEGPDSVPAGWLIELKPIRLGALNPIPELEKGKLELDLDLMERVKRNGEARDAMIRFSSAQLLGWIWISEFFSTCFFMNLKLGLRKN